MSLCPSAICFQIAVQPSSEVLIFLETPTVYSLL